jgi:hypothetical protein
LVFYSLLTNKKIVLAPLLAAILAAGLLFINPTSITNAQAQMYNDGYGDRYYDDSYYKDVNRYDYDSPPKKSSDVSVQELECVNSDVNVNGIDLTKIQDPTTWGAANELAANEADDPDGANGNGLGDSLNVDRNLVNICVNVNVNEQTRAPIGEIPPEETATLLVTKTVACVDNINNPMVQQATPTFPCSDVTANIDESLFIIDVTDTNPIPSQFPGSEVGTSVTLGPGTYTVEETPNVAAIEALIDDIEQQDGFQIIGPVATFSGDCAPNGQGTIAAGDSETCEIENTFTVEEITRPGGCTD